jgi:hypothetical protein
MARCMARLDASGRVKKGDMSHALDCGPGNGFKPPLSMIDAALIEDDVPRCSFCGGGPRVRTGKFRMLGTAFFQTLENGEPAELVP